MSRPLERPTFLRRLPNTISVLRILMVPAWLLVAYLYRGSVVAGQPEPNWQRAALLILLALGLSDVVDGWLARRFGATSDVGAVLDAVADKLAQVFLYGYLAVLGPPAFFGIPLWFLGLLILRDVLLAIGVVSIWRRGESDFPHRWHGKLSSVLLFGLLVWVGIGIGRDAFADALDGVAAVVVASTALYVRDGWVRRGRLPPYRAPAKDLWDDEPKHRAWARRLVSIPTLFAVTALAVSLAPVLLILTATVDLITRRDFVISRCMVVFVMNLFMHSVGVVLFFFAWLFGAAWAGVPTDRERRLMYRIEVWWARGAYRTAEKLFRMKTVVEGEEVFGRGPLIVFIRHASIVDTLLPVALISKRFGTRFRYVMKRELLKDPAIDLVGHHVPGAFVRRGSHSSAHEIDLVRHLMDGLQKQDAVVLYPEGTRFTSEKQARVLKSIAKKDPASFARASTLKNLLPPRIGGPLALLEKGGTDVIICAHTGLEGANHLSDVLSGVLLDGRVRVRFWRVPASEIPTTRQERIDWLYDWWARVDAWIDVA